ncbi:hypothetical protein P5673_028500, partial [Acropora cervicornis]
MINDWDIQVNVSDILGAEPVHFSWTMEKKHRKPPAERKHQESPEEPDNTTLQTVEFPSSAGSTEPVALSADISAAVPSRLVSSDLAQTEMESPQIDQTESDIVLELQRKIALLSLCWLTASKGLGETIVKESQPYQEDELKKKPGPSRKRTYLDEFLLVLMRLKAGLFVQDLADRFGISTSLEMFPFPSQDLVRKNMPKEFAQYATTRIILDCTELFIQRPSAMLAQSET